MVLLVIFHPTSNQPIPNKLSTWYLWRNQWLWPSFPFPPTFLFLLSLFTSNTCEYTLCLTKDPLKKSFTMTMMVEIWANHSPRNWPNEFSTSWENSNWGKSSEISLFGNASYVVAASSLSKNFKSFWSGLQGATKETITFINSLWESCKNGVLGGQLWQINSPPMLTEN